VALAAAAGAWLWRFGPLPPTDPFAGTVAVLPLVLVALDLLRRLGERRGGRRLRPELLAGLAAGLASLLLAILARPHLDLAGLDGALAAGLALLLALYLGAQLLALRPLLGGRLPDRPSALFFALPLAAYVALIPWSSGQRPPDGDEPWYLLLTHSLAYDFDTDLTNNYAQRDWRGFLDRPLEPQPGDPQGPRGELYSRHNALLPLVLAPAYRAAGKFGALVTMAALSAALAWMTLSLGRHYAPDRPGEVLAAYALVAFAPPLLLYSYQIWVEVPAALLSAVALDGLLRVRRARLAAPDLRVEGSAPTRRRVLRAWVSVAVALLLLPLLKIRFMLLAVPLLLLAWWHAGRPWKPALALGLALGAAGGGILLHNQLLYGNPLKIHSWAEVELHRYSWGQYAKGFAGLFWDAAFGLFGVAPLWLLLLPAMLLLLVRRHPLPTDLVVFVLPYLAIVAPRAEWYGGWSPPFRYALVAMPLLGLALVPLLAARRRAGARALLAGLGGLTLAMSLLWIAVPGWTYNFADGRTYLLDHLSVRLGADVARLFPSAVRPRAATWIWPVATVVAVPAAWWLPGRRRGRPALWGLAALLAGSGLVAWAARTLPTRVVEAEDPYVTTHGGRLHPGRWEIDRTRHRGAWVLREGEGLDAPVVAGGSLAALDLEACLLRQGPLPLSLEVRAGERLLTTLEITDSPACELRDPRTWKRYPLGEHPWPPGASLHLRLPAARQGGQGNGLAIDRLEIRWR
jgi:hypothetical protein